MEWQDEMAVVDFCGCLEHHWSAISVGGGEREEERYWTTCHIGEYSVVLPNTHNICGKSDS